MEMNVFICIRDGKDAKITASKAGDGVATILVDAASMQNALELLKDAERMASEVKEKAPGIETTANQNPQYCNVNMTKENAQKTLDSILAGEPGYEDGTRLFNMLDKAEKLSSKHRSITAMQAHYLTLKACLGDIYASIIDTYNIGFYKGYNAAKRDNQKGVK